MMNTNNTYFENLHRIGCEYEAARTERQNRKEQIIETYCSERDARYAGEYVTGLGAHNGGCSL